MTKMLPLPNIVNEKFKHTRPWQSKGEHAKLYTVVPRQHLVGARLTGLTARR